MKDFQLYHSAQNILSRFCVAGIDFHHADTKTRGRFAVNHDLYERIIDDAKTKKIDSFFILSTCNRTEIYCYGQNPNTLVDLLISNTEGSIRDFEMCGYTERGEKALMHLFEVAAGLDSQILGDYEILGQLKRAVEFARQRNVVGPILERTINFVLQSSKKIRKETKISTGTVSVSYAAIELMREIPSISDKKVTLIGTGKIGTSVCRNLKNHLQVKSMKVVNRTNETARQLANELEVEHRSYEELADVITESDIIIVCTNAPFPTIQQHHISDFGEKLILDLSIPLNVEKSVKKLPQIKVIDVDEISKNILDKTLSMREAEVPKALAIINEHKNKLWEWLSGYQDSLYISIWRNKLDEISGMYPGYNSDEAHHRIQKTVNRLAGDLRNGKNGCMFIHAVKNYLQSHEEKIPAPIK